LQKYRKSIIRGTRKQNGFGGYMRDTLEITNLETGEIEIVEFTTIATVEDLEAYFKAQGI
jgi:hypothetical protein